MGHVEGLQRLLLLSDAEWEEWGSAGDMTKDQMFNAVATAQIIVDHTGGNNINDLKGLTIVDVGCGGNGPDLCPPFFGILAGMYGAKVHGIDLFPYTGDGSNLYTHHEKSLLECLHRDGKIDLRAITGLSACDVVVCTGLAGDLVSPTLEGIIKVRGLEAIMPIFEQSIRDAAKKVLKPNGFFLYNGDIIEKEDL